LHCLQYGYYFWTSVAAKPQPGQRPTPSTESTAPSTTSTTPQASQIIPAGQPSQINVSSSSTSSGLSSWWLLALILLILLLLLLAALCIRKQKRSKQLEALVAGSNYTETQTPVYGVPETTVDVYESTTTTTHPHPYTGSEGQNHQTHSYNESQIKEISPSSYMTAHSPAGHMTGSTLQHQNSSNKIQYGTASAATMFTSRV
jgi:hypothetical protein